MINLLIEQSASHLLITPSRSLGKSIMQAHNLQFTALMLLPVSLCLVSGLWPIAIMLLVLLVSLLYIHLHVAELRKREEHLTIDINQLELRRGMEILISTKLDSALCIYVSAPGNASDPLIFELTTLNRPNLSFAKNTNRKDSVYLLELLKRCGLTVIQISTKDQLVKSF